MGRRFDLPSYRVLAVLAVLALLLPTTLAGVTHSLTEPTTTETRATAENVTFVSTQGTWGATGFDEGRIVALHTDTRATLWTHDSYSKYYDVDPLDDERLLFTARHDGQRYAVVVNWRNDTEIDRFPLPHDTHDIDSLGDGRYVVADKEHHRIYVYDRPADRIVWSYRFRDHYPDSAGDPEADWTHLNDVDAVANGTKFLASPRNFDRVVLIDRDTKETVWTLGSEDDYEILNEQHNPTLLQRSPPTVLVADSENDRVVEYRRTNGTWTLTWGYRGDLQWPRDADRLPNGNTLVVDSQGDRVVEITPDREIVWEYATRRHPYDVERLAFGDEPQGPPMTTGSEFERQNDPATAPSDLPVVGYVMTSFDWLYRLGTWVLPAWVGKFEFLTLLGAVTVASAWGVAELALALPRGIIDRVDTELTAPSEIRTLAAVGTILLGLVAVLGVVVPRGFAGVLVAIGLALVTIGWTELHDAWPETPAGSRIRVVGSSLLAAGLLLTALVLLAVRDRTSTLYVGLGVLLLWQAARVWRTRGA